MSVETEMNRNRLFFLLRFLVSFLIIAFIIIKVDFSEVIVLLPGVKIHFILIALLWLLLDKVVMSYRWSILLKSKGIEIPIFQIIKIYFLSSFWGTFLPSSVAPDAIKVYVARKHGSSTTDILSSVVVDRIIGLFSLSLVTFLSLMAVFFLNREQSGLNILLVVLAILFLTVLLVFFDRLPLKKFQSYFSRFREDSALWNFLRRFYKSCMEYKSDKSSLLNVLLISLFNHILTILMVYVISLSLGLSVSISYLFVFVPLVNFLIIIPISIGGIGIQEGAYVYFLSQIGMSAQEALAVALIFRVLTVISSLPGGVVYMSEGFQIKKASV